jgi:hypothetical protein
MKQDVSIAFDKQVYYRLIALWIFCEAVLGGIIHGLKLPVSGLIVGSCSVICICLIGRYVSIRHAILKATIIVAIFKMMLSPHAPPTAYVAVFFQGAIGQAFLRYGKFYKISCIVFGAIALAESALQRILVMTIVFGNDIWKVINETITKLTGQNAVTNYSLVFGIVYLAAHIVVGISVGLFAFRLATQKPELSSEYRITGNFSNTTSLASKKKKIRIGFFIIWLLLVILFLQSEFSIGTPVLPSQLVIQLIFRSILIVLTWYFLVSPLLLYFTRKWLQRLKEKQAADIQAIALLIPATENMIYRSWQLSAEKKGFQRIKTCCKIILMNTLHA